MPRELFVYYRVRAEQAAAALCAVQAFQSQLASDHPNTRPRLLRRPDQTDGLQTWMETYAADATVQAEIERRALALAQHIVGGRHTEVFVPCA